MEREACLDYMRVFATICVVIIHCCASALSSYGSIDDFNWGLSLILRNLTTVSVPLFFMISGYLYLNKPQFNMRDFYLKRLKNIIIPMVVWSWFWLLFNQKFNSLNLTLTILWQPIFSPTMYHLWFLYPLIALYLSLPFIIILVKNMEAKHRHLWLIMWIMFGTVNFCHIAFGFNFSIKPELFTVWVGYFIAGYLMTFYKFNNKLTWLGIFIINSFMIIGTYLKTDSNSPIPSLFYELNTPHVMLLSCLIFNLMLQYKNHFKPSNLITFLSNRSFTVYLIHPFFIIEFNHYIFNFYSYNLDKYYLPSLIILSVVASYAVSSIIKLIKLDKLFG
jgi:surface polysaccharide O-acyltransferase-like enzyme